MSEIKTPEQVAEELNKSIATFKEQVSNAATKEELDAANKAFETFKNEHNAKLDGLATKEELKAIEEIAVKQGQSIQAMKANGNGVQSLSFKSAIKAGFEGVKKQLEDLKTAVKSGETPSGEITFTVKAPVNMTTGASANASGVTTPDSFVYQSETNYMADVVQRPYITDFTDNGSTDKSSIPYIDKIPTEGQFEVTAEGALKPLLSTSFEQRFSTAIKIAGRMKLSEESLDDIPFLTSAVNNELRYEHDIAKHDNLLTFAKANATAYVAGAMADSTDAPSNYDAIRSAIYFQKIVSKGKHMANVVFVNPADAYNMGATKDNQERYIIPAWVAPDGSRIGQVQIVEENDVTVGEFLLGDFRALKIRDYISFTIRIGYGINASSTAANITSDFETNMLTMIGESRFHRYIYENEKTCLVNASYAAVKTAIDSAV